MRSKYATTPDMTLLQAFRHGITQTLSTPIGLSLIAAPLVATGVRKYDTYQRSKNEAITKAQSYKDMLSLHPHFKQRDQADIGRIFNSLHNASPALMKDPLLAGAWVDHVYENKLPGLNSHQALRGAIQELTGTQKNVLDIARSSAQSSRADAAGSWVKEFASELDKSTRNSLTDQANRERAVVQAKIDELKSMKELEKSQRAQASFQSGASELMQRLDQREQQLRANELAHRAEERRRANQGAQTELPLPRPKTSMARTSLREMLQALKV